MKLFTIAICLVALFVPVTITGAAPLYYEGFNYNAGTTVGPQGGWATTSGFNGFNVVAPGGSYGDVGGMLLQASGNSAYSINDGVTTNNITIALPQAVRDLFSTNGTFYVTFLIKEKAGLAFIANLDQSDQILVNAYSGLATTDYYKMAGEVQLGVWPDNFNADASTTQYWIGTGWALWAMRIVMRDGADEITILRNPTLETPPNWETPSSGRIRIDSMDITSPDFSVLRVVSNGGIDMSNWPGSGTEMVGGVDEIRVGTSWADVAPLTPPDTGEGFYEGFDYPVGSTVGNEGGWTTMSGYNGFDILAPGGSYTDSGGNALVASGNHAYTQFDLSLPMNQRKYNTVAKTLSPAASYLLSRNGTVYMSFLLKENASVALVANPDTADQVSISVQTSVATTDYYYMALDLMRGVWPDFENAYVRTYPAAYWKWLDWAFIAVRIVMRDGNDEVTVIRNPADMLNPDWEDAESLSRLRLDTMDLSSSAYSQIRMAGTGAKYDWAPEEWVGGLDEIRVGAAWADCVPTEAPNLPTVGASNKAVLDEIMLGAAYNYYWVLWGVVSERTDGGFKLDDGSGVTINVSGANSVADGDYVSVKGLLDPNSQTLTSQTITKHSP